MSKVVVLGIDGASPNLLLPWVEQGKLPNLRSVLHRGASGTLHSTMPPYSAQAWVSMMTGRQPAKHGVVDFFERKAGRPQHAFLQSASIEGEALWDILTRQGKRIGIVNVPLTYPPVSVNGYMVSGFMTPRGREDYTYPPELREEIVSVSGRYEPDPWDLASPEQDLGSFASWMEVFETVATHLHDNHPVDLYVSVVQALDQLQHHFWDLLTSEKPRSTRRGEHVYPTLEACYSLMDLAIGRRLAWLDEDTTLFITSDHGFQPVESWFHVNCWLAERGFLHLANEQAGSKSALRRLGVNRDSIKFWVRRLDPLGLRRRLGRFARAAIADSLEDSLALPIDWSRTQAYSGSRTSEGIYINLRGREPEGTVPPEAYEEVRTQVMDGLGALVDPATGQSAVSAVYRREDLYRGPFLDLLPDVLFSLDDRPYLVSESTSAARMFSPLSGVEVTGRHHSHGMFAAVGPHVSPGAAVNASIVDVAPTVLYAMGQAIPADMDGRVLEEIFDSGHRQRFPVRYEKGNAEARADARHPSAYSNRDEAEMESRLRDLGYID